jgi:threonine aldolase
MKIDLRSDTVTKPSEEMRAYMACAPVGDDAYGEDESVNALQDECKRLFQKEEALFVTSGMMANRLAFLSQISNGDEAITADAYHVNFFDSAPMAAFGGIVMNPRPTKEGVLDCEEVLKAIYWKQRYHYFAQPRLISVENTINGYAGKIFPFKELQALSALAEQHEIFLHLDGARLFNAHIATGIPLHAFAAYADTLSVCFSKGLGAPYGSVLMGSKETIQKAKKFRLWLGGGVHQAGMLAAGACYALRNNINRLKVDHQHARLFSDALKNMAGIFLCYGDPETNMVQFSIHGRAEDFYQACIYRGLLLFPWVPGVFRAVFHQDISFSDLEQAICIVREALSEIDSMQKVSV